MDKEAAVKQIGDCASQAEAILKEYEPTPGKLVDATAAQRFYTNVKALAERLELPNAYNEELQTVLNANHGFATLKIKAVLGVLQSLLESIEKGYYDPSDTSSQNAAVAFIGVPDRGRGKPQW